MGGGDRHPPRLPVLPKVLAPLLRKSDRRRRCWATMRGRLPCRYLRRGIKQARHLVGINGLYVFSLLCYYATLTAAATKTKPIGDDDNRRFTIILNSASTAAPIGLLPKMAEFCHTPNRLFNAAVPYCGCILIPLLTGRSVVGGRSEIKVAGL